MAKEYKCFRGEYDSECCKNRVEEAVKHCIYIIVLIAGIACLILALTIKLSDNSAFADQLSFASTVTSIILSIIAIWMSISGERNINDVKQRVSDSAIKLEGSTKESIELVENLKNTFDVQEKTYKQIINNLENVISNVENMKNSIGELSLYVLDDNHKKSENSQNTDSFQMFKSIIDGIPSKKVKGCLVKSCSKIFESKKQNEELPAELIGELIGEITETENDKYICYGIITSLIHNGFFIDGENETKLLNLNI